MRYIKPYLENVGKNNCFMLLGFDFGGPVVLHAQSIKWLFLCAKNGFSYGRIQKQKPLFFANIPKYHEFYSSLMCISSSGKFWVTSYFRLGLSAHFETHFATSLQLVKTLATGVLDSSYIKALGA